MIFRSGSADFDVDDSGRMDVKMRIHENAEYPDASICILRAISGLFWPPAIHSYAKVTILF